MTTEISGMYGSEKVKTSDTVKLENLAVFIRHAMALRKKDYKN